ncbi:hypothetical protein H6504_00885 [Candidatus Woesearchaeota archaeon]|nr:hypothetical protein [Candidatus Woesearchaeota archaeon]
MTIVGFNFTKIVTEKKAPIKGKLNITNNVSIKDVQAGELNLGNSGQKGLKFTFEFTSKYEPGFGEITLNGEVMTIESEESQKKTLESWKKDKKIGSETMTSILNHILTKANIQALVLSTEVGLPPPIQLPKVQSKAQ